MYSKRKYPKNGQLLPYVLSKINNCLSVHTYTSSNTDHGFRLAKIVMEQLWDKEEEISLYKISLSL